MTSEAVPVGEERRGVDARRPHAHSTDFAPREAESPEALDVAAQPQEHDHPEHTEPPVDAEDGGERLVEREAEEDLPAVLDHLALVVREHLPPRHLTEVAEARDQGDQGDRGGGDRGRGGDRWGDRW